jgi:hypothetical protein
MNDIMLDLETLGTSANSVILSIGAVRFDAHGSAIGETFYRRISIDSCLAHGMTVSGRTLLWWIGQSDDARMSIAGDDGEDIEVVLKDLGEFIQEDDRVWGCGAAFDNALLTQAYESVGLQVPWKYYNNRCYRTLKALYFAVERPAFEGIKHHALDDALNQAKHLQVILSNLQYQAPVAERVA